MNDDINYIPASTPDFQTELAEKLAEFAPEAIADGKIDVEKLQELLNGDADESNERFGLFWPGKKRALRAAQQPTTATLKPDLENSKDWDTTKNVFIEGDNLEVLKVLQKHYHGKIKMIYIDPPYNTGKDFVYPDNFKEGLDTYLEWTKQVNEEGQKLSTNSEAEGRYHSNWLNLMYPRLKLARNLLRIDGSIMISINDTELPHLLRIGDEIFGEANRIAIFSWKKRGTGGQVAKNAIIKQVEYVLVYARSSFHVSLSGPKNENSGQEVWRDFRKSGGQWQRSYRPKQYYPFYVYEGNVSLDKLPGATEVFPKDSNGVDGFWENGITTARMRLETGDFQARKSKQGLKIYQRDFQKDTSNAGSFFNIPSIRGTDEIKSYFGDPVIFENPKPTQLMMEIMAIGNVGDGDIVLDFFAGSGTTADAVLRLNSLDGKNRRHFQIQLPEPTSVGSHAFKAGYSTISELARERIRRAGDKIQEDFSGQLAHRNSPLDVGFRAYKLSDTNFSKWQVSSDTPANELEQHLLELRESANDSATPADLFVELLLKQGYSLTEDIGDASISGLDLKTVLDADGDVAVLAYLDEHTKPTLDQLREIADSKPVRFVILEDCFQGDDELKTNLVQICKTNGIELWTA